ncbi:hypothetical protein V5799_002716 [Amblyomma americanum]|uniref:Uncharacterized protein n=1 Tax=Amblyomma americanum TaxID=6943 RepID=A0AAQ4DB14_AMBAM
MDLDPNGANRQSTAIVLPLFYEPHQAVWFYQAEATFYYDGIASPAAQALLIREALAPAVFRRLALRRAAGLNCHALKGAVLRFYGVTQMFPSPPFPDAVPSEPPCPEQHPCSSPKRFSGTAYGPTPPHHVGCPGLDDYSGRGHCFSTVPSGALHLIDCASRGTFLHQQRALPEPTLRSLKADPATRLP